MALNFNIPLPGIGFDSFLKGFGLTDNLMQQILGRNQLKQKTEHEKEALEQADKHFNTQESRLNQNADLIRKNLQQTLLEHELKTNPKKLFEFIQAIKNQSANGGQGAPQESTTPAFNGTGMPSNETMENTANQFDVAPSASSAPPMVAGAASAPNKTAPVMPQAPQMPAMQAPPAPAQEGGLFGNLTPDQQIALSMAGIKIPTVKENPQQKRYAELQDKIRLEQIKTEQKKALEQEKLSLKNEATRQKTQEAAKNDIPHLESTLHALEAMETIAKNNPDMFGHSGVFGFGAEGAAERFTKTSKNPNVGAWQTHGLGPIVAAEMKMTSKGNQLALKTSLANKPNLSETQPVALAKIKTNIKQIKDQIKENKKLSGIQDEEKVVVIRPDGKRFKTTKTNAKHLPKGWKHG
jgi:hypothetical protein